MMELDEDQNWLTDRSLSSRLPRAWPAFFARFGRLTEVQRATVGPVLDGKSVLVCAPTAAGKTEAACAPLMERYCRQTGPWTALYVSPTRALVNDLYERLAPPLGAMGLKVSRRTGDFHDDIVTEQPHVLLTTPESFDSLLCRGRHEERLHVLAHVVAVVLDEVHLLFGTARGEQVRWQLERLRRLRTYAKEEGWCSSCDVQMVGLSATLPDPQQVLQAYFGESAELIQLGGGREIELVGVGAEPFAPVDEAVPLYVERLESAEKILVFANAKKRVDELSARLAPVLERSGYQCRGHHAALAKPERERSEHAVKKERRIVLFSTSTLEIGVDIGDIDLVVLDGPPPDVSSFLQRIGRGNRRTGKTRVMLCAEGESDALVQRAMLEAARASYLGPLEVGPQYAVSRQQLASFIYQGKTLQRSEESALQLIRACAPEVDGQRLLDHLVGTQELVRDERGVRLGHIWQEAAERGEMHSNIEAPLGSTVVDHSTGDAIALGVRFSGGRRMAIAGAQLDVKRVNPFSIDVQRSATRGRADANWSYATSKQITGASQPQAVRRYLGIEENQWPVVPIFGGAAVFHFGGARRAACLALMARRAAAHVSVNAYYLKLEGIIDIKPDWIGSVSAPTLDVLLSDAVESLERDLGRPKANAKLPLDLRMAEVRRWVNLETQIDAAANSVWLPPLTEDCRTSLLSLL